VRIVALVDDLTAWMQTLALAEHPARRWESKRLRPRLLHLAAPHPSPARCSTRLTGSTPWPSPADH
jgi:hypothetical protein